MTILEQALAIREAMNQAGLLLTESQAASLAYLYKEWTPYEQNGDGAQEYKKYNLGCRCRYNKRVYECRQEHLSQPLYSPDLTPALWKLLDIEHKGSINDPIIYVVGMEIFSGKYYIEDGQLYLCIRNSETPLYHELSNLIGLYVEKV